MLDSPIPSRSLSIVIVGGGIGGMAAAYCLGRSGHKITVVDSLSRKSQNSAGIQLSPNATRLLIRWGLEPELRRVSVVPENMVMRSYKSSTIISSIRWGVDMQILYGAPYLHLHRNDLVDMLSQLARPYIVALIDDTVTTVDFPTLQSSKPVVHLSSSSSLSCDLVVGADGVNSLLRHLVTGRSNDLVWSGDIAYRALIPAAKLLDDPSLRRLCIKTEATIWVGPKRHIVGYNISGKREYNLVMVDVAGSSNSTRKDQKSKEQIGALFEDWDPLVQRLISLTEQPTTWYLTDRGSLDTWSDHTSSIVLLGDACHPMLPYRAQGAAMAIEDAAVLGRLLSRYNDVNELEGLLKGYCEIRRCRTINTQEAARANRHTFHLDDSEEQRKRDRSMAAAHDDSGSDRVSDGNANQWANKKLSEEQFMYDAEMEADNWLHANILPRRSRNVIVTAKL